MRACLNASLVVVCLSLRAFAMKYGQPVRLTVPSGFVSIPWAGVCDQNITAIADYFLVLCDDLHNQFGMEARQHDIMSTRECSLSEPRMVMCAE